MDVINIKDRFIGFYEPWNQIIASLILIALSSIPFVFYTKKLINFLFTRIDQRYGQNYLELDKKYHVSRYLFHSIIVLYSILYIDLSGIYKVLPIQIVNLSSICILIYGAFSFTALFLNLINIFVHIYKSYFLDKHFPIQLPVQILKIFIISLALIIVVSQILHVPPISIITSLGAATAFLTFVFREALAGLMASLQLILQNKIQIGDQISVPQYNINGEVETITVTEVKIRANNGSIMIVPPHHLLTANIINLRDIKKAKLRKISRIIYLDINSVVFCSESMLNQFNQSAFLTDDIKKYMNSTNRITNLEAFKLYANNYLKEYLVACNQPVNFSVREAEPALLGLISIEINIHLNKIGWEQYEKISSEVYLHLIAILPEFQIKVSPK